MSQQLTIENRKTQLRKIFIGIFICVSVFFWQTIHAQNALSQIHINVDVNKLNFGDYCKSKVSYFNPDGIIQFKDSPTKIKYRGNASAHYGKKNFTIKFIDSKCFSGNCHKHWKLNAEYIDKTFLRNKLSYDLFRLLSPGNYAPHIHFSEVYLNGRYNGLYAVTERIDEDRLKLNKSDTNCVIFKEPPISTPPEQHQKKYLSLNKFSHYAEFYKSFSEKAFKNLIEELYYNQRFPDVSDRDKSYLIHQITEFIYNSSDEDFSDEAIFSSYFNLKNIIDWHLLLLITNNSDGLVKNFYLYRMSEMEPFYFCPWDYDHSYGRDGDGELNQNSFLDISRMRLLVRLLETNAFNYRQKLFDRFQSLKKEDILTAYNIHNIIDNDVFSIEESIHRNENRWPVDSINHFTNCDFYSEVALMKKWIGIRLIVVENYLTEINDTSVKVRKINRKYLKENTISKIVLKYSL